MNPVVLLALGAFLAAGVAFAKSSSSSSQNEEGSDPADTDEWRRFDGLFQLYGGQQDVPWTYLKAFCLNESDLGRDPRVVRGETSSDGLSWGIMQLTLPTANDFESTDVGDLNTPATSVRIAAKFVRHLMGAFETIDARYLEWVVKSYNQGEGRTKKERDGLADEDPDVRTYFERWQRNLARVQSNP